MLFILFIGFLFIVHVPPPTGEFNVGRKLLNKGGVMRNLLAMFLAAGLFVSCASISAADEMQGSGGTITCDICTTCSRWVEVEESYDCTKSCNCRPDSGGQIHCELCPATCTRTVKKNETYDCPAHSCNCRPGS